MTRFAAFLRGINVGSRRVSMPVLRDIVEAAGGTDVMTYVQSGNIVLTHHLGAGELQPHLECHLADALGFDVGVVVRTGPQLDAVVAANPFPHATPTTLVVWFLATPVDAEALSAIDLDGLAPEELAVAGHDLYLHLPNGQARATLPKLLDRATKKTVATARNWRTVTTTADLVRGS
jgi:uncharacterized protein (DUF1697 family)